MEIAFEHPEQYGDFDAEHIDKLLAWAKWKASQRLDTICKEQLDGCPYYVRHVAIGDPAEEILNFVHREKIDMIVMPTRGAKADAPAGSVAEKVVKQAPVPVVTVPPDMETAPAA